MKWSRALVVAAVALLILWLAPRCSRLPPAAPPERVQAPASPPKPSRPPPPLVVLPWTSPGMFPNTQQGTYHIVYGIKNQSTTRAYDMRVLLTARKGETIEQIGGNEVMGHRGLIPGASTYWAQGISTGLIEGILAAPRKPGTEIEWGLSYHLDGEDPEEVRCLHLRALPRRGPEGIVWIPLGETDECDPQKMPAR